MSASSPVNQSHAAFVALGSNIDPSRNLPAAVARLQSLGTVRAVSRVWQSAAVGDVNQPAFLNAAALLSTSYPLPRLRQELRDIEAKMGRVRDPANKNAARPIDLDLAFFDRVVCRPPAAPLPDPATTERSFVAVPLAELAPRFRHPICGRTLAEIAAQLRAYPPLTPRDDVVLQP